MWRSLGKPTKDHAMIAADRLSRMMIDIEAGLEGDVVHGPPAVCVVDGSMVQLAVVLFAGNVSELERRLTPAPLRVSVNRKDRQIRLDLRVRFADL